MRIILYPVCLLAFTVPVLAQQPGTLPDAPGWTQAEALKSHSKIHVSAKPGSASCRFKSADDGSLICSDGAKELSFQRSDVRKITSPRRGWSALIGLGIGVGVGAILGAATGDNCSGNHLIICFSRGSLAAGFGSVLGVIGAGVGAATDFDRKTVYRAL